MSKNRGPNKENLDRTHSLFIKNATAEFLEHGYVHASTNRIVESTGMARGSLYYHFGDKKGLFIAVYKQILTEAAVEIEKAMKAQTSYWEALKAGCATYISLCIKKERRSIILEAHTALNYAERIELQRETLIATLEQTLKQVQEEGYFAGQDPFTISILIYGMVSEAGRSFEMVENPDDMLDKLISSTLDMLEKMGR